MNSKNWSIFESFLVKIFILCDYHCRRGNFAIYLLYCIEFYIIFCIPLMRSNAYWICSFNYSTDVNSSNKQYFSLHPKKRNPITLNLVNVYTWRTSPIVHKIDGMMFVITIIFLKSIRVKILNMLNLLLLPIGQIYRSNDFIIIIVWIFMTLDFIYRVC